MSKYTVIGFCESDSWIFCEHVEANDSNDAVVVAVNELTKGRMDSATYEHYSYDTHDINIIEVLVGHVESVNDCRTVSTASDWPGVQSKQGEKNEKC